MKINRSTEHSIVSLLPGATEVVHALGAADRLAGRSHECDYPPEVENLPVLTEPKYEIQFDSAATDKRLRSLIREGLSLYRVDEKMLQDLAPDIIITQDHCEACAVPYREVEQSVQALLEKEVRLIDFSPSNLQELYDVVFEMGQVLETKEEARRLTESMKRDFFSLQSGIGNGVFKEVVILEWLDPLMSAGNWLPDLVEAAGGRCRLGRPGSHAEVVGMEDLLQVDPDVLILASCGYSIEQTRRHLNEITTRERWSQLKAVQNEEVYLVDANHYFNRPGPRLTDSARIVAEILHPRDIDPDYYKRGWRPLVDRLKE